jgi:hypothetical protein
MKHRNQRLKWCECWCRQSQCGDLFVFVLVSQNNKATRLLTWPFVFLLSRHAPFGVVVDVSCDSIKHRRILIEGGRTNIDITHFLTFVDK